MSYFGYLTYDANLIPASATVLTSSSADANYPLANLSILPVAKTFRTTGITSESVSIDLGSAQAVDLIGLLNHNFTSGVTITVNGGSSSNPNGSQFSTSITYRATDCFVALGAAQTWRYWKVIIADPSNTNSFLEMGYALLGSSTRPTFNYKYGAKFMDEYINLELRTEFGVPNVEEMYHHIKLQMDFWALAASTDAVQLRTLYQGLKRNLKPFFLIPDVAVNDGYFGRITNQLERLIEFYQSLTFQFEEDPRGRQISL